MKDSAFGSEHIEIIKHFGRTRQQLMSLSFDRLIRLSCGLKGNRVRVPDSPAAVSFVAILPD